MKKYKSIGRLIGITHRSIQVFLQNKLKPIGLPYAQSRILKFIQLNEGVSQNTIQSHFNIDKGSISILIKELENNGFIKKTSNKIDKRAFMITTTNKSRKIIPKINCIFQDCSDQMLEGFTEGEKTITLELIERMARNISREYIESNDGKNI